MTTYICTECGAKGTKGWHKTDLGLMHYRFNRPCGPVKMMRAINKGGFYPDRGEEGLIPDKEEL